MDVLGARSPTSYLQCLFTIDLYVGFKTPAEAIEGQYVDKKCPFTSDVSIRGRIFK
jgi:hypothetical protein